LCALRILCQEYDSILLEVNQNGRTAVVSDNCRNISITLKTRSQGQWVLTLLHQPTKTLKIDRGLDAPYSILLPIDWAFSKSRHTEVSEEVLHIDLTERWITAIPTQVTIVAIKNSFPGRTESGQISPCCVYAIGVLCIRFLQ